MFLPFGLLGQNSTEYVSKCRMYHSLFKSVCSKLTLNNDMTYELIDGYSSDLQNSSKGKYYWIQDTIYTIDDRINEPLEIKRSKNNKDLFFVNFDNGFNNSVYVDSVEIFNRDSITKINYKIHCVNFTQADSLFFYLLEIKYKIRTDLRDYKTVKLINVFLPVDYYIANDKRTILKFYGKSRYKKINVL